MRAELSVVIPTLNAEQALPVCLAALMEGVEAGLIRELVVSDGGSTDASIVIADDVGALVVTGIASRGGQLRRGAKATKGAWILFLHADTVLQAGWAVAVEKHLGTGRPGYFKLSFDRRGMAPTLVARWANLRSKLFHLPYGDQGLLISRAEYEAVGGYDDSPLMEDVAMARRIGSRLTEIPLEVKTSAARYVRDGWIRRSIGNFRLLMKYFAGVSPEDLRKRY